MQNPNVLIYMKVKHFRGDGVGGTSFSWVEWVSGRIERIQRSASPGPPLEDTGRFIGQLRTGSTGCLLLTSQATATKRINFWSVFMSPVYHSSQRVLPQLCLLPCGSSSLLLPHTQLCPPNSLPSCSGLYHSGDLSLAKFPSPRCCQGHPCPSRLNLLQLDFKIKSAVRFPEQPSASQSSVNEHFTPIS